MLCSYTTAISYTQSHLTAVDTFHAHFLWLDCFSNPEYPLSSTKPISILLPLKKHTKSYILCNTLLLSMSLFFVYSTFAYDWYAWFCFWLRILREASVKYSLTTHLWEHLPQSLGNKKCSRNWKTLSTAEYIVCTVEDLGTYWQLSHNMTPNKYQLSKSSSLSHIYFNAFQCLTHQNIVSTILWNELEFSILT